MREPETGVKRIVVGVDGSAPSRAALRWAQLIAGATKATIQAVIAWEYPTSYGWAIDTDDWQPDADAEKVLEQTLDSVFGANRPPGLRAVVTRGHAREVLLSASNEAEMLVVGSRGHGGFAGLLLGSVSAACAEHAKCPVLVVHGEPA